MIFWSLLNYFCYSGPGNEFQAFWCHKHQTSRVTKHHTWQDLPTSVLVYGRVSQRPVTMIDRRRIYGTNFTAWGQGGRDKPAEGGILRDKKYFASVFFAPHAEFLFCLHAPADFWGLLILMTGLKRLSGRQYPDISQGTGPGVRIHTWCGVFLMTAGRLQI